MCRDNPDQAAIWRDIEKYDAAAAEARTFTGPFSGLFLAAAFASVYAMHREQIFPTYTVALCLGVICFMGLTFVSLIGNRILYERKAWEARQLLQKPK
jgi:hypothetical protein